MFLTLHSAWYWLHTKPQSFPLQLLLCSFVRSRALVTLSHCAKLFVPPPSLQSVPCFGYLCPFLSPDLEHRSSGVVVSTSRLRAPAFKDGSMAGRLKMARCPDASSNLFSASTQELQQYTTVRFANSQDITTYNHSTHPAAVSTSNAQHVCAARADLQPPQQQDAPLSHLRQRMHGAVRGKGARPGVRAP